MLKELFVLENIHLKHDNILKDIGFGSDQNQDSDPSLQKPKLQKKQIRFWQKDRIRIQPDKITTLNF